MFKKTDCVMVEVLKFAFPLKVIFSALVILFIGVVSIIMRGYPFVLHETILAGITILILTATFNILSKKEKMFMIFIFFTILVLGNM